MHDKEKCRCDRCQYGEEWYRKQTEVSLARYGWYSEFLEYDPDCPNHVNYHTVGFPQKFNHRDLQICFPATAETAHMIFTKCIDAIKQGVVFKSGKFYDDILGGGYRAKFILATEGGRFVMRLILPNPQGGYAGHIYSEQFNT